MICQHKSRNFVWTGDVRRGAGQSNLDRRRSPGNELGQSTLSDTQERLVDLIWIHLSADNIENGNVAALFRLLSRDHLVVWLQQSSHHIHNTSLANYDLVLRN